MRLGLAGAAVLVVVLIVLWARREATGRAAPARETPSVGEAHARVEPATGRVTARRGRPAADALVLAFAPVDEEAKDVGSPSGAPWGAWTVTGGDGSYALPGAPGEYDLIALAPDGSHASRRVRGQAADLEMVEGTPCGGLVLRAEDGAPLPGARVAADLGSALGARPRGRLNALLGDAAVDPKASACLQAFTARSRVDGAFDLFVPRRITSEVVATAPGRDTDRASMHDGTVGPLVLGAGGSVTGNVREPDGTPIAGALVELYPEGTFENSYGQPPDGHRATATGADGRFEFAGLPDGVRYRADAHHPLRDAHAARVAVPDGPPVDLVLAPLPRVEAYVDYGEWRGPVDCFGVSLAGRGLGEPFPLSVESGRFVSVPLDLPPGTYELRLMAGAPPPALASRPVELPATGVVAVHGLRVPDNACVFRLRSGRFALRAIECVAREAARLSWKVTTDDWGIGSVVVAGQRGLPLLLDVPGVDEPQPLRCGELVDLDLAAALASRARVRLPALAATEVRVEVIGHGNHEMGRRAAPPDRTLEFKSRDRTSIKVSIAAEGRTPWIRRIGFDESRDVVLDAELPPLRHARVRLVDAEGRALPGVALELKDADGLVAGHAEATTDAEGRAVLPVLPGSVLRLADSPLVLMQHMAGKDLDPGRETPLRAARAGAIRGEWRSEGRRESHAALLLGLIEPKLPVAPVVEIDHAGRFHLQGLPPGRYRLATFLGGSEWFFDVAAGRTTVVALR